MYAIALIIIVLCLLVITYKKPKLGFIVLGSLLLAVLLFYWLTPTDKTIKRASPLTDYVTLSHISVKEGYADGFLLAGRVTNSHQSTPLEEVYIRSKLSICETEAALNCVVLGDETNLLKEYIPGRQARDFSINLRSRQLVEGKGFVSWEHRVANAK
ncbi:MAG: hypothetical protein ACI9J2_002260 [Saprospiraceae bacterium]|jgi:hypothetical protein